MKPGRGKAKGSAHERQVCKDLSRWITNGEREDCLWRSAISGGRATVAHRKGKTVRQGGDICSVSPEGHALTDHWLCECKHVRKLQLDLFLVKGTGELAKFWKKALQEAERDYKTPVIIAKQNGWPILMISTPGYLNKWALAIIKHSKFEVWDFKQVLNSTFQRP